MTAVRGRRRSRQEAIALSYKTAACGRVRFEQLYREHCGRHGKLVSDRALQTRWMAYRAIVRRERASGGSFFTTNGQRAAAMARDGRPRCTRTMRRVHRDLEAMGLAIVKHKVRSGPARRPGELDCLAIALLPVSGQSYVRPRRAEQRARPSAGVSLLQRPLIPPATPADDEGLELDGGLDPPPAAERPDEGGEDRERERSRSFRALWTAAKARARAESEGQGARGSL